MISEIDVTARWAQGYCYLDMRAPLIALLQGRFRVHGLVRPYCFWRLPAAREEAVDAVMTNLIFDLEQRARETVGRLTFAGMPEEDALILMPGHVMAYGEAKLPTRLIHAVLEENHNNLAWRALRDAIKEAAYGKTGQAG